MPEITDSLPDACAILVREIETVDEANALRLLLPRIRLVIGLAAASEARKLRDAEAEEAAFHGERRV